MKQMPLIMNPIPDFRQGFASRGNIIAVLAFLVFVLSGLGVAIYSDGPAVKLWALGLGVLLGCLANRSPKVAKQWECAIVLRLGKYRAKKGAGLFWIIPLIESVSAWIDQRTITTSFAAGQTLTSDTVPVKVDAVQFWMVYDPEKAALEVQDYMQAVSWAAQTALRDINGQSALHLGLFWPYCYLERINHPKHSP
jgi:regulator of protease activity HflC (stomatin/prohibitin superfamily)